MLLKLIILNLVCFQFGFTQQLKARAYLFKAVVDLSTNTTESVGTINFVQNGTQISITGILFNVPAGRHGFHIHEFGNIDNQCLDTGGHYNPHGKNHGAPDDENRHVGDLGNVEVISGNTVTNIHIVDSQLSLVGTESILGRGIVLHEGEDDLGRGGKVLSKTTGNAGTRYACGVIGIQKN